MANANDDSSNFEAETEFEVRLYIYDLSKGFAKMFASIILGKELPGIWHTGVVVYGREYFFGGMGIESCNPGETILGEPDQIVNMGKTEIPYSVFLEFIFSLGESVFAPGKYDLFENNCNNFSNEVITFLVGKGIPREILELPNEVLSTPLGQTLRTYLQSFDVRPHGTGVNLAGAGAANQLASENSAQKSVKSSSDKSEKKTGDKMAEPKPTEEQTNENQKLSKETEKESESDVKRNGESESAEDESKSEKKPLTGRRTYKYKDPPILYREVDGSSSIKKLTELVHDLLNPEENKQLKEWQEYLETDNGAWVLGTEHMDLIAHLLNGGSNGKFAPNVPLLTLQVLQAAALKDDFVLVLHQDRKDHRLMSYINRVENLTLAEQEEIIKLMCNLCSQPSSFDWLMYISEWSESDGQSSSNARVTTRAAVHTLLNDKLTTLQKTGCNLIFNLALKELFEDTATELATAVLQFLHGELEENQVFLCLTALLRFMQISYNDVPALTKMLGPDINKFKGMSQQIDPIVEQIEQKLKTSLGSMGSI
ncbi:uncharacterized protein B4U79_01416 [Dinothrombium tinctorium]|uniref:PPPDE domain-containing protein n=1 Tax=Dinothrombium tinctorium TaxID=1965070 RepID=A0A443R0J8_9ACAR|nr:uncharacterized protein B4U79_01416 [Dinothrombium tinctorium]